MTPRQIRGLRVAERFMPRLWSFGYPISGRGFKRSRRVAFRLWCEAFRLRVRLFDV